MLAARIFLENLEMKKKFKQKRNAILHITTHFIFVIYIGNHRNTQIILLQVNSKVFLSAKMCLLLLPTKNYFNIMLSKQSFEGQENSGN